MGEDDEDPRGPGLWYAIAYAAPFGVAFWGVFFWFWPKAATIVLAAFAGIVTALAFAAGRRDRGGD